ncbi:prostatic acid phosphatase-like [Contarinia nasturtii]|uniref:prostatic acid phosphatase-like n=1 Tax=Contarinia nasturtii TaxID=265458 RepID=UPI0012D3CEF0|nr:prostatic acid phosphatase-like [Contarinia nasturtii]
MFWPDLASSHYAKKTLDWLTEQNIPFVPKKDNPPDIPQARLIEDFWSVLKRKVYEKGWEAQNEQQLIGRIKQKLEKVDILVVQSIILKVRHVLRQIEDNGSLSVKVYPSDPNSDEIFWTEGYGQLTKEGKNQLYELGQYLRRRYRKLLGDKYSPNKVYCRSTDTDRTLMSAQATLASLFPPDAGEIWNEDILWQPIPVHTVPGKYDFIIHHAASCSKYQAKLKNYMNTSPEVQQIYARYAHQFSYWSKMIGKKIETIFDIFFLSLPYWAEKAMESNGIMEYISQFSLQIEAATPQLARCKSSFLIKEILEHFTQKINKTLKPDRVFWLYSAHDLNIAHLLKSLGLFKLHFPCYGSSLHFELYKTNDNEHYFQLFYRQSNEEKPLPLSIPKCGEICHIDQFYAAYRAIIPSDFEKECS